MNVLSYRGLFSFELQLEYVWQVLIFSEGVGAEDFNYILFGPPQHISGINSLVPIFFLYFSIFNPGLLIN